MKAAIYARYSSDKQRSVSIEQQLEVCRSFAERNGYEIVKVYEDRALTGTSDKRPGFQQMIQESRTSEWEYLIVYQLDRFARDRYDSAIYKRKLKDNGVRVLSAMENITDFLLSEQNLCRHLDDVARRRSSPCHPILHRSERNIKSPGKFRLIHSRLLQDVLKFDFCSESALHAIFSDIIRVVILGNLVNHAPCACNLTQTAKDAQIITLLVFKVSLVDLLKMRLVLFYKFNKSLSH